MNIVNIVNSLMMAYPVWFQLWFSLILAAMFAVLILKVIAFILDLKFW